MKLLESIQDRISGLLIGGSAIQLQLDHSQRAVEQALLIAEEAREEADAAKLVKESLIDLELGVEDVGWRELTQGGGWNFSRTGLRKMIALSRLMYLANPLIRRAVTVQELYVFGAGFALEAQSPEVQEVLNDFFNDEANSSVIGPAFPEREREQRIEGNTFFALFTNKSTGAVRVRVIPTDFVCSIIHNPEDNKEPWYYRKTRFTEFTPLLDNTTSEYEDVLYPDIRYNPRVKPYAEGGVRIDWDVRILHVKTGGLSIMRFGMPELFSAIPWATAYKKILENFATILGAYARFAMKITKNQGKKGIAASKSKLQTGVNAVADQGVDNNPPANTASFFLASGGMDISAIKTAHSTTGPDEARALRSMVAAGTDTPEHFFGDSDIGNFATSETLDRPTELKMISRQSFWGGIISCLANFVIVQSAKAPGGKLRDAGFKAVETYDSFDRSIRVVVTAPNGKSKVYLVKFPNITERSIVDRVRAVVQAVTLNGSSAEGIFPDRRVVCKFLLDALGLKDNKEILDQLYPEPVIQGFIDPALKLADEHLKAEGQKELGDAAMWKAKNPAPVKSGPSMSTGNDS